MFLNPRYNRDRRTKTAFCSYHAILNTIGKSFTLSNPKASFNFNAITANE